MVLVREKGLLITRARSLARLSTAAEIDLVASADEHTRVPIPAPGDVPKAHIEGHHAGAETAHRSVFVAPSSQLVDRGLIGVLTVEAPLRAPVRFVVLSLDLGGDTTPSWYRDSVVRRPGTDQLGIPLGPRPG